MSRVHKAIAKLKELLRMKVFQALLFILLGLISYFVMFDNVKPEKINVSLLTPSDKTIRAPQTVVDKEKTEQDKQEAAKDVEDVFTLKKEYAQNRVDLISSIFDSVKEVKEELETKQVDNEESQIDGPPSKKVSEGIPAHVTLAKQKLTGDVTKELSDSVFSALLKADDENFVMARDLTLTAIHNVMSTKIPAREVEPAKNRVEEQLKASSLPGEIKQASIELARFAIIQNEFYDSQKSEEKVQAAVESVEPVKILQGEVIVEEGQLVDRDIYRQLKLAGFLEEQTSYLPFIGLGLLILLTMSGLYYYFQLINENTDKKQSQILLFSFVYLLALLIMKTVSLFQRAEYIDMVYFFPAAFAAMLIKVLLNERLAIAITIVLASYGTIIFNDGSASNLHIAAGLYILLSGTAGIILLYTKNYRTKILQAGLLLSVLNFLLILALLFIMDVRSLKIEFIFYIISSLVSGLSSSILTMGVLPFFETGFGILTTVRLIELSNPNHPLLRRILTEAPGTYHHSIMVANLAESACESIGANGLLARVGCYYHDIGKTKRPQFFIENQMNIENPHDRLDPEISKDIIIAHVSDGVESLRKYRMPEEIVSIAREHHGTTLLKYFYHKAAQQGEDVREAEFRYPGPKPQTKETAVISIADSVEAAVRSMGNPTSDKIDELIKSIIVERLQDGQFNECDITMKELDMVNKSLSETLKGIFHNRIEYPDFKKTK
ncbi:putative nucleotidyltransferase with HDIG domain [Peribacillus deserti]|uniref:Nucleotidyltransferase with HDIG domain n=1 Tax=Peribacillus deserti TaxID=673318 RepID=A0ABS2QGJ2_9BACI|nr:HD family phosphohydrolase [Peribacillus deserti]MBM7691804.1 putative nucleotidyltransferase with HDIG domain [Peribacillus deserti]